MFEFWMLLIVLGLGSVLFMLTARYLPRGNRRKGIAKRPQFDVESWSAPIIVVGVFVFLFGLIGVILTFNPIYLPNFRFDSVLPAIVTGVVVLVFTVAALFYISNIQRRIVKLQHKAFEALQEQASHRVDLERVLPELLSEYPEKRERFLNTPSVSFHYADEDRIKSFYVDYFREPTIESFVTEAIGEVSGDVKAGLPRLIESRVGAKDIQKWISTASIPDLPVSGMFQRYQRETIKNGQVALGIEEVDIELTEIQAFDKAIGDIRNRFAFSVDSSAVDQHRVTLRQKAAERTLKRLESVSGPVLIEGLFEIGEAGDHYKLSYRHPVSAYLPDNIGPITISLFVRVSSLYQHVSANYSQSVGASISLRVYGDIWRPISRDDKHWDLQITPLAVY